MESTVINLNKVAEIDTSEFLKQFGSAVETEMGSLLEKLSNKEDKAVVQDISMKMVSLYQQMYFVKTEAERKAIQRTLNNYKSAVKAISARYQLDVANTIISICKQASVIALGVAVKFVAL